MMSSRSLATTIGPIGESRPADAARSQHLVELILVGAVVGDRGRRVLELVAGQDAHDPVRRGDHALFAQPLGTGDAGGAGGLAAQPAGTDRAFASMISWSETMLTTPLQNSRARRHFFRLTGRLISIAEATVDALICSESSWS